MTKEEFNNTDKMKLFEYINSLEINFEKEKEENKLLKSDNNLIKKALKEKEKIILDTNFFKNKRIKELEQKLYDLENKQMRID